MSKNNDSIVDQNISLLWEQISSIVPVGIIVTNLDGRIIFRNNLFERWMPKFPISDKLWFLQMQSHLEQHTDQVIDLTNLSVNWIIQNLVYKDMELDTNWQGQKHSFRIKISPLFNEENKISGLIEITENITEIKETDKSLQHARRFETVGRLASGIAHDFNNILQVINGHSEMLLELRKEDTKLARSLDIILTSGQKASALTRQLLLFSRRQQGELKQINLGEMIFNMQKILSRMLGEDIVMAMENKDNDAFIDGDESQLEQIIMNLAINARDAMPEGGKINILTQVCELDETMQVKFQYVQTGTYVNLVFSDTGSGIPPEIKDHIFEPFFTTKDLGRGTGLGLSNVYSIVKQHQGYIQVESELGIGTTFSLYFPVSSTMKQDLENICEPTMPYGTKKKVLILEDDENVRDLAVQVLSQFGYLVRCASTLSQANSIVTEESFDLHIVDIVLPDGNGVSFIEQLLKSHSNASFILTSGYTEDKPQIKETLLKGYSFLHKPFTISALLQACSDTLQKHL